MVVTLGATEGFALLEVNPEGLLVQLYVCPITDEEPTDVEPPAQIDFAEPTLETGRGFTVTITESDLVHPVAVIFSVSL